jgi:hypothetical protein
VAVVLEEKKIQGRHDQQQGSWAAALPFPRRTSQAMRCTVRPLMSVSIQGRIALPAVMVRQRSPTTVSAVNPCMLQARGGNLGQRWTWIAQDRRRTGGQEDRRGTEAEDRTRAGEQHDRTKHGKTWQNRIATGQHKFIVLDWTGWDWVGLDSTGLDCAALTLHKPRCPMSSHS